MSGQIYFKAAHLEVYAPNEPMGEHDRKSGVMWFNTVLLTI